MTRFSGFPISTLPSLAFIPLEESVFGLRMDNNGAPAKIYANTTMNVYCMKDEIDIGNDEDEDEECMAQIRKRR